MLNTTVKFRVNGVMVAYEQFANKTQKGLDRAAVHFKSSTEFIVRATLQQSGASSATITICEDAHELEYRWTAIEGTFGSMSEGKIVRW